MDQVLCPSVGHILRPRVFLEKEEPPFALGERVLSPLPMTCLVSMLRYWLLKLLAVVNDIELPEDWYLSIANSYSIAGGEGSMQHRG